MMRATIAVAFSATAVAAFAVPPTQHLQKTHPLAYTTFTDDNDSYEETMGPQQQVVPQQEQSAYFSLEGSDLAGNWGFDPLGLARNKENLWMYREAEMKHARLAMLAVLGWPVSEVCNRPLAEALGVPSMEEAAPSFDSISPVWWGSCLGISAAMDMYGTAKAQSNDPDYIYPGRLGLDPLNICDRRQNQLELAEISNGRLAMVAFTGFALQEYLNQMEVWEETTPVLTNPW